MTDGVSAILDWVITEGLSENDEKGPDMKKSEAEISRRRKKLGQDADGETSFEERRKAGEAGE